MNIPLLSPYAPENLVSRDGFSSPVPRQPAHLHTQAESGAYLRDSSRVPQYKYMIVILARHPIIVATLPMTMVLDITLSKFQHNKMYSV